MLFIFAMLVTIPTLEVSSFPTLDITASAESPVSIKILELYLKCSTIIFIKLNIESETVPLIQVDDSDNKLNFSVSEFQNFFHHTWSPEELKTSLIVGPTRHQPNVVTSVLQPYAFNAKNVGFLLWKRYLRPHLDYVVILDDPKKLNSNILGKFRNAYTLLKNELEIKQFHGKSSSLAGRKFRVVGTRAVHLLNLKPDRNAFDQHGGVEYKMLQAIAQTQNFSYEIQYASGGGGTGTKLPNGTWVGVVGDVYEQRADFGIGSGTTKSRQAISDVSTVYEYVRLTFFNRTPFPVNRWQALFWSFDTHGWVGVITVTVGTLSALVTLLYMDGRSKTIWKHLTTELWEATETVLRLLLEQSSDLVTKDGVRARIRFLLLVWTLGSMLIGTAYKSKLVAFLTFPYTEKVPETFQELVDSPDYKISFKFYGGVAYSSFKSSQFPVQRKLFSRFYVEKSLQNCIEAVALHEKTICIVYKADASSIIASNFTLAAVSEIDYFGRAKEYGMIVPLGWAFPKGSPITEKFSLLIGLVKGAGLYDFWIRREILEKKMRSAKWLNGDGDKIVATKLRQFYTSLERTAKPLLKQHVMGPFFLLIGGIIISVVVGIVEKMSALRRLHRKRNHMM